MQQSRFSLLRAAARYLHASQRTFRSLIEAADVDDLPDNRRLRTGDARMQRRALEAEVAVMPSGTQRSQGSRPDLPDR